MGMNPYFILRHKIKHGPDHQLLAIFVAQFEEVITIASSSFILYLPLKYIHVKLWFQFCIKTLLRKPCIKSGSKFSTFILFRSHLEKVLIFPVLDTMKEVPYAKPNPSWGL